MDDNLTHGRPQPPSRAYARPPQPPPPRAQGHSPWPPPPQAPSSPAMAATSLLTLSSPPMAATSPSPRWPTLQPPSPCYRSFSRAAARPYPEERISKHQGQVWRQGRCERRRSHRGWGSEVTMKGGRRRSRHRPSRSSQSTRFGGIALRVIFHPRLNPTQTTPTPTHLTPLSRHTLNYKSNHMKLML